MSEALFSRCRPLQAVGEALAAGPFFWIAKRGSRAAGVGAAGPGGDESANAA